MITCSYCGSEIYIMDSGPYQNHAQCTFCNIILGPESSWGMYATDNERVPSQQINPFLDITYARKDLKEIDRLQTCDILYLLKMAREERAANYNLLRIFNKAVEVGEKEFQTNAAEQGIEYEYWTRRCWMLENLLIKRLGYFPDRIYDAMILKMRERFETAKAKLMKISTTKVGS